MCIVRCKFIVKFVNFARFTGLQVIYCMPTYSCLLFFFFFFWIGYIIRYMLASDFLFSHGKPVNEVWFWVAATLLERSIKIAKLSMLDYF